MESRLQSAMIELSGALDDTTERAREQVHQAERRRRQPREAREQPHERAAVTHGRGQHLLHRPHLRNRQQRIQSPHIKEVRGKGLWIGIELHREAGGARRFCEALQHEGLLCKETHDHVIRIAPPLTIKREEIDWAVERLEKVLTSLD